MYLLLIWFMKKECGKLLGVSICGSYLLSSGLSVIEANLIIINRPHWPSLAKTVEKGGHKAFNKPKFRSHMWIINKAEPKVICHKVVEYNQLWTNYNFTPHPTPPLVIKPILMDWEFVILVSVGEFYNDQVFHVVQLQSSGHKEQLAPRCPALSTMIKKSYRIRRLSTCLG